jgi:succinate dehydrogenase/fumarate reductase cytochrome b subunit
MLAKIGMAYHTDKKSRGGDLRFFLQRGSAIILLAFIGFHVVTMHRWDFHVLSRSIGAETVAGGQMTGLFRPAQAFQSTAGAIRSYGTSEDAGYRGNLLVIGFYALGIWAVCYHVANGLATGAMAWGITVTEPAQRRCTFLCFGVWVALTLAGTAAWCAFVFGSQPG